MINNNNHSENDFLRDLIDDTFIEKPSKNFTANVMNDIHKLSEVQSIKWYQGENFKSIISFTAIIVVSIGIIIYYFSNMVSEPISLEPTPNVLAFFKTIFAGFIPLFESIQISSITLIIIFSTLSLYLLDKLLRKAFSGRTYFISF
jgi:hypothetical protein